ncbi:MAG: cytochrome c [Acidobacteriia bacterium]|nr:cytochrome c [Terriglobia bacterium]
MKPGVWFTTILGAAVLVWSAGAAQKEVKKIPVTSTRADSAVEMFKTYCASCHGVDGKGHGPAAEALKVAPSDLTMLKQKNDGKFPSGKVTRIVEGADVVTAHGSTDMPTWGPIFRSLDPNNAPVTKLRIANLTKYIESMQR